jgi:phosphatidylinositol alpha-1,6-mannosyltransferase
LGYAALALKRFFNVRYYLIVHGWEVASKGMFAGKYKKEIKNAQYIIANSNFTKNETLFQYPGVKGITVIPPMINEELLGGQDFDPEFKRKIGAGEKKILLTVGRLSPHDSRKGHDLVLMVLPEILDKYPEVVYLIVGDGESREHLKDLAQKLGVQDKVIFCDYDRELIRDYYNICDIFIMPSRLIKRTGSVEGFGIVFLEAAMFGKPCIGGRTGGISDVIIDGKTGLLVDPVDVSSISGAVMRLLGDPEYASKLGKEAKERAQTEFSREKIGARIKKVFIDDSVLE